MLRSALVSPELLPALFNPVVTDLLSLGPVAFGSTDLLVVAIGVGYVTGYVTLCERAVYTDAHLISILFFVLSLSQPQRETCAVETRIV